jgi:hypothetical protein
MIQKVRSPIMICDICGKENTALPECYTVFSHRDNRGWDKKNEELDLQDRPDYCYPDFHVCPPCSTIVFNLFCANRRKNNK